MSEETKQTVNVGKIAKIAVLSAMAGVIMFFDFPLWFAPYFYEFDFSEVVVLIGGFAMGPLAAAVIEFLKILIKMVLKGSYTFGIGEIANFLIGCALVLPASFIYSKNKTLTNAVIGLLTGVLFMAVLGGLANYFVLIPFYANVYGAPIEYFVDIGTAINSNIVNLRTFIIYAVVPFNLFKGIVVSAITLLVYKKISPVLHK